MFADTPASAPTSGASSEPDDKNDHWLWTPCAYTLASIWVVVWMACAIWMAIGTLVAKQSHDRLNEMRHALIEAATKAGQAEGNSLLSIDEAVALLDSREQFLATLRTYELERLEVVSEIGRLELLVKDAQENYEQLRRQADDGLESKVGSQAGAAVFRPMSVQSVTTARSGEPLAEAAGEQIGALAQLHSAKAREAGFAARMTYLQDHVDQLTLAPELELLAKDVRCVSSMLGIFF